MLPPSNILPMQCVTYIALAFIWTLYGISSSLDFLLILYTLVIIQYSSVCNILVILVHIQQTVLRTTTYTSGCDPLRLRATHNTNSCEWSHECLRMNLSHIKVVVDRDSNGYIYAVGTCVKIRCTCAAAHSEDARAADSRPPRLDRPESTGPLSLVVATGSSNMRALFIYLQKKRLHD